MPNPGHRWRDIRFVSPYGGQIEIVVRSQKHGDGAVLLLRDQDRSKWDRDLIRKGFVHLAESASGTELSRYHLEASIAACHARATDFGSTDWSTIVGLYEILAQRFPSDVASVSHAIAAGHLKG